jgi:monoamine oxidase
MIQRRDVLIGSSAALLAGVAPQSAWGKTEADVLIIGAGLAGLCAAHLLERAGLKTVIIEGNKRVGGRLHTLTDLPGKPEAGGIQVGSGYRRLRAIADDLKVALNPSTETRGALFHIDGKTIAAAAWENASQNKLNPQERAILPSALGAHYNAKLPQLVDPSGWLLGGYDTPYSQALQALGASDQARSLIAANLNGNGLESLSKLHIMRSSAIFRAGLGPVLMISGGSERLTQAMAARLKSPVRLGQIVTGIAEEAGGVTVGLASGRTLRARHVICTIPFAALRGLSVNGSLHPALSALIPSLGTTRASFAYLSATEPFWSADGSPETLWSNDPLLGRVFVLGIDPPMLKVWLSGKASDALDAMPAAEAGAEIIRRLEAARPSAKGKLKLERLWSWQKNPMARGLYHHIAPGQGKLLAAACQAEGSRLHFAGEHLAQASSGMEGALESGARVAQLIVAGG